MDLNKILDSSNVAFSRAQKVCRWVAFGIFALYVIATKMYAGAILPDFWLGIVGVVALVLLLQNQTFRVGVCFAYTSFALFGVLWILFFYGKFDENLLNEVLVSVSNEQGINAQAIPVVATLGACALILLSTIAFILTCIQKFAPKIPSIFLGFLVLTPLVYLAPEPLYAMLFPQKYYANIEKVPPYSTNNPLPIDLDSKPISDEAQKAVDFAQNLSNGAKSPDKLTPTLLENALNVIYKDGDYRLHNANDYYKKTSDKKIAKLKKAYELAKKPDKAQMLTLKQSILQSCTIPNPCTTEKEFEPEEFELEQLAGLHYGIDYLSLALISSGEIKDRYFEEALSGLRELGFPMWLDDDTPTSSIALYFYGLQILSYVDDESPAYKAIYNESKKDFAKFKKVLESKDYENLKDFLE